MHLRLAVLLTLLAAMSITSVASAQRFGFTTEPLIPVGKFAQAIDIGWGATGYVGMRLGGRKSPWFVEADVAVQWHAGDSIDNTDFPGLPPSGGGDAVQVSGFLFPIRASISRLFGRAYFSPRVGAYIPTSDLKNLLQMKTSFGTSPKIGYLMFITRDLTADLGLEYTVIFDREPLMYVGFSFGFLMGGQRLPRRRLPY